MSDIFEKFRIAGQVAIVTGGAGLLGQEFCRTLAEGGANVVVADLSVEKANGVAAELRHSGHQALGIEVDVTQPASVQSLLEKTVSTFSRLDILVCSAAMDPKFDPDSVEQLGNTYEDYPLEAWKQALDVNLTGMFLCTQAAGRQMLRQNRGVMINICSIYGLVGPDQRLYEGTGQPHQYKPAYYSVTKAGVLGLTRYLATYYMGKHIRCNALTPGGVYHNHDDAFLQRYSARTVLGRMANQDEMNGALLFLASDASTYMTGANLVVDGGWTAW